MSKVWFVGGLGFGDEGKGGVVEFLTLRENAKLVCRFNGGAQAGHNVVDKDGRHHTFSQFGSGTFEGALTFLSRYMLVNPCTLVTEAQHLEALGIQSPLLRVIIENRALVTTPFHMAANRIREMARTKRHGSCGMGIGETMSHSFKSPAEAYYVRDLLDPKTSDAKLRAICEHFTWSLTPLLEEHLNDPNVDREWDILSDFDTTLKFFKERQVQIIQQCKIVDSAWLPNKLHKKPDETVIFEGAQGVLLDQDYGFAPHTTWTDCTFGNAERLLSGTIDGRCNEEGQGHVTNCRCKKHSNEVTRVGVLRGYMTRHGAGPLVTEDASLTAPGEHNAHGPWQQGFRLGHFDAVAIRYALEAIGGVDQLALTCLDHLQTSIRSCTLYASRGPLGFLQDLPVTRPKPVLPYDSEHQERQEILSTMLVGCQPTYTTLHDVGSFITHVEQELKTPVEITSFGPKASDKRTL